MAIESLGIGSSVLTNDLVDQIINAEKELTEKRLDSKEELINAKITAYGEIQSKVDTMENAMSALSSPSTAGSTKASSSDESLITATASSVAEPGSYNVEVINTAKAHSLATQAYADFDQAVGAGKLVISFGEITYGVGDTFDAFSLNEESQGATIDISATDTLSAIREKINNEDIGVTANIINDGSGYRLVLSSDKEGVENAMRIEATDTAGNLLTGGLADLAYNENQNTASNLEQTSKGENAEIRVNGLSITRDSNQVTEVIKGVTLNLKSADVGKQVNIEIEPDTDKLVEKINEFVDAYNELKLFVDDLTEYDAEKKQGGLLSGDATVRTMMQQIRSLLSEPVAGLNGTKYKSLTELGVSSDQFDRYQLGFDQAKFNKAISEERDSVVSILAKSGSTTDSQIVYVNDSIKSKAGTYDVAITQLATQAEYNGETVAALGATSAVTIDDTNDQFVLNLNGTAGSIQLRQDTYANPYDLVKEINYQINSNTSFSSKGYSASAIYDPDEKSISFVSSKYGSESSIYVGSVDPNTANTLGFNALGSGAAIGQGLLALNQEAFNGRGASTIPASQAVSSSTGINFSLNNATFSLAVDGNPAVAVTVNQNAQGTDLNSDGIIGDRKDTLQAIQTAIDATTLNGVVEAKFDANDKLVFETVAEGSTKSIDITTVGVSASDVVLGLDATQGPQTNGKDPGLNLGSPAEFKVEVDGAASTTAISIPAGTYASGAALATEIENQILATLSVEPAFTSVLTGGKVENSTKDLSIPIDFSAMPAGFTVNLSGVEREVLINTNGTPGNNLANIQSALDTVFPPAAPEGGITASIVDDNLVLTQNNQGHDEYIQITSDGRGAQTTAGGVALVGTDFSTLGDNATFTLTLDGVDINVDVNSNATLGTNDAESTRKAVEQAVNAALDGNADFAAGDVLVKLDGSNQIYFESVSKDGVKSGTVFGHNASIEIKNVDARSSAVLGLSAQTQTNGYDNFGFTNNEKNFGGDYIPEVTYNFDADANTGSFDIAIGGNSTQVRFTDLNVNAITVLGLQDKAFYTVEPSKGQDVEGTINGIEANGKGQYLTAQDGNVKASNGFYIANKAADFTAGVNLDATNNKFKVEIDGVEAEVSLTIPASYNSGEALASALQTAINETAAFKDEDIKVKVEYGTDSNSTSFEKFGIISASTGKESRVEITEILPAATNVFGFIKGIGSGSAGSDKVGEVDLSSGIRLKVLGGPAGDRGSVTYISGIADQLSDLMDSILKSNGGLLSDKRSGFDQQITQIEEERARLKTKVEAQEARLKQQFLYNDKIVNTLKTTESFIKQQFEAINASNK